MGKYFISCPDFWGCHLSCVHLRRVLCCNRLLRSFVGLYKQTFSHKEQAIIRPWEPPATAHRKFASGRRQTCCGLCGTLSSHRETIIRLYGAPATVHRKVASRRRLTCGGLWPHYNIVAVRRYLLAMHYALCTMHFYNKSSP